jgi:hypothetical protein
MLLLHGFLTKVISNLYRQVRDDSPNSMVASKLMEHTLVVKTQTVQADAAQGKRCW